MFKRMSVLVRRPDHDRATFSRLWEQHAAPVSGLPRIRGYVQNHIEEDFSVESPITADGFVELLWDSAGDMAEAFAGPAARPMFEDEPGFLGHGSGYALSGTDFRPDQPGVKLLIALRGDGRRLESEIQSIPDLVAAFRDDVSTLIAKPGMVPPQPVDAFFHLWFPDVSAASQAGSRLVPVGRDGDFVGVYRVATKRFV